MAAAKKAAESTLYHVHPKGFWKKFRELLHFFWPVECLNAFYQATLWSLILKSRVVFH
jgi:hypothetical protein